MRGNFVPACCRRSGRLRQFAQAGFQVFEAPPQGQDFAILARHNLVQLLDEIILERRPAFQLIEAPLPLAAAHSGSGGCHSSTRFPSGSTNQPKRPKSCSSRASSTSAPPASTFSSAASRSSTTRLIM